MGPIEIGVILAAVALLFGPKFIPEWGRSLGDTFGYIKKRTK